MKSKKVLSVLVTTALAVSVLTGCGGGRGTGESAPAANTVETAGTEKTDSEPANDSSASDSSEGGEVVGVALPWLGTQNWAEAEVMFKEQLEAAGYEAIIQAADQKVPQQQQQIESMIENGAKVIVVGPVDGSQLGSRSEERRVGKECRF